MKLRPRASAPGDRRRNCCPMTLGSLAKIPHDLCGFEGKKQMGGLPKIGVVKPPPNHPFVHRVWNHYFHLPFWGFGVPLFLETPRCCKLQPFYVVFFFQNFGGRVFFLNEILHISADD